MACFVDVTVIERVLVSFSQNNNLKVIGLRKVEIGENKRVSITHVVF